MVGFYQVTSAVAGETLRVFLAAFSEQYGVVDLLVAETAADATARGWASAPAELAGTWAKNPEVGQTHWFATSW